MKATENSKKAHGLRSHSPEIPVFDFLKKKKQDSCWVLLGHSAFMEFSTGLYIFRSHTQWDFLQWSTDKKAVWLGDNCTPLRQTINWGIFYIVSEAWEMLLCAYLKYEFIGTQRTIGYVLKCVLIRNKHWQAFRVHVSISL